MLDFKLFLLTYVCRIDFVLCCTSIKRLFQFGLSASNRFGAQVAFTMAIVVNEFNFVPHYIDSAAVQHCVGIPASLSVVGRAVVTSCTCAIHA